MSTRVSLFLSLALMSALEIAAAASGQQAATKPSKTTLPPASIWYTEQFVMHSKIVARDFLIQIGKPTLAKGVKAPAIYLLDGNSSFGMVADMLMPGGVPGTTGSTFVVGIGYPSQKISEFEDRRLVDLSHVRLATPGQSDIVGEGAKFQRFLTEELRPLIEARYAVDPKRAILVGHSIGGLFVAHVLLNDPKAFDGYVIGSPSIAAEPELLAKAKSFVAPVRVPVFIAVGGGESELFGEQAGPQRAQQSMLSDAKALADLLMDHSSNLDVKFWVIPDETHFSMRPAFYERAMQVVLPAPSVATSAAETHK